jgi:hypothetical protein
VGVGPFLVEISSSFKSCLGFLFTFANRFLFQQDQLLNLATLNENKKALQEIKLSARLL